MDNKDHAELPSMTWLQGQAHPFTAPRAFSDRVDDGDYIAPTFSRELPRADVSLEAQVSTMPNSTCFDGVYVRPSGGSRALFVKSLTSTTADARATFMAEAMVLVQFSHSKIVDLVGAVTLDDPLLVCFERMHLGSLHTVLNHHLVRDKLSDLDLLRMAADVCAGMHHLAQAGYVHGKLAARNVLVNLDMVYVSRV